MDAEQWLRRCIQTADGIDVPNKTEYFGSLAVLGNLIYDAQTILEVISEETMQQSSIAEYLAPEAREQGIQQGIQQGAQETTRKHILGILTRRFQFDAAQNLKLTLDGINDLQRLKQLFRTALRVESPEEFTRALKESSN